MPSATVQTYIFPKAHWDSGDAVRKWLQSHNYEDGLDETDESWRARQRDPGDFAEGSFRTICIDGADNAGDAACRIKAVVGHLKEGKGSEIMIERKSLTVEIKDAEKGQIEARFATFLVKDEDDDWTLPGAFEGGAKMPISSYGHASWRGGMDGLPPGIGEIKASGEDARLLG